MPGPPPKPGKLKLLHNTLTPGDRRLRMGPSLTGSGETPPTGLSGRALDLWRDRAADLLRAGLAELDRGHVARACRLEALGLELLAQAEAAPLAKSTGGRTHVSAALRSAMALFESADRIWFLVGVTPSERSRLAVTPPESPHAKKAREYFGD
jgi:hypothetical protein